MDWKKNKIEVIVIIALFLLAFGIRTIPSSEFPNIYGFDSFWASRMTKYIVDGEHQGWPFSTITDSITDYPWGRPAIRGVETGWWLINAVVYKIAGGGTPFNYNLFGKIASWMAAILGSLAIPAIYLFGKKAFNKVTGLASALFLAVSTNHLFYSIYGHAENDGFGLSLFFLCLFSFILTVKEKKWKYGLLNAILFSWLAIVWQAYAVVGLLVAGTIGLYYLIFAVMKSFDNYKESEERKEHRKWMINALITILPSVLVSYFVTGFYGFGMTILAPVSLAIITGLIIEKFISKEKIKINTKDFFTRSISITFLFLILGSFFYGSAVVTAPAKFIGITIGEEKTFLPYEVRMLSTIAEQNPVPGNNFIERLDNLSANFGLNIWLALISVILIFGKLSILPFLRKDFTYEWDILALAFLLFSLYTLTEKAITMFFLAGVVAFGAGYFYGFVYSFIEYSKEKLKNKTAILKTAVIIILVLSFTASAIPAFSQTENMGYDIPPEWFSTFEFLNTIPKGSVVTAWWDYGHWMNYFNGDNIYVTQDNIQDRKDIIYTVASAFTHITDCSQDASKIITCDTTPEALETAEIESLSILKPLKTNYILIDKEIVAGGTGGKYGALKRIAGIETGCIQEFSCIEDGSTVKCNLGYVNSEEGPKPISFQFPTSAWNELIALEWPGQTISMPVTTDNGNPVGQINTRYFAKDKDFGGKTIYATALNCGDYFFQGGANSNAPALYSFQQRLFFNDPNLKHVTKVYDDGWNVIYKVDWTGIPDPDEYSTWTKTHSVLCAGEAAKQCALSDYKM